MKKDKSFWVNLYDGILDLCSDPLIGLITVGSFCMLVALVILLILSYPILLPIILISIALLVIAYKFVKFMAEAEDIDG